MNAKPKHLASTGSTPSSPSGARSSGFEAYVNDNGATSTRMVAIQELSIDGRHRRRPGLGGGRAHDRHAMPVDLDIDRAFGPDDGPDSTALMGGFPPLVDAADRAGQRQPEMSARAYLAESINEPNAFIPPTFAGGNGPTTAMPQLTVTSEEVDALIDHLLSK